ncbi:MULTISPECIES: thermonuclease family protein [unclassified Sphingobium]|uniref:thermonuclease family protein n=1 Tax=unclassified Sphingobium TaxID=2611147 RepID=UPI0009715415|nr:MULTISPECIES: thermonuclease family protein [unclassified Sphingobium]
MFSGLLLAATLTVIDGDTLRIDGKRLRLVGIDAPEIHACPSYRRCVPGDGQASKRSLQRLLSGSISIRRVGHDRFGRTLAHVYSGGRNVACEMIRLNRAVYVQRWDTGSQLARECR